MCMCVCVSRERVAPCAALHMYIHAYMCKYIGKFQRVMMCDLDLRDVFNKPSFDSQIVFERAPQTLTRTDHTTTCTTSACLASGLSLSLYH